MASELYARWTCGNCGASDETRVANTGSIIPMPPGWGTVTVMVRGDVKHGTANTDACGECVALLPEKMRPR